MGKADNQTLPTVQRAHGSCSASRAFLCRRCPMGVYSFKCAVVLIISVAAFLSAVFWLLPIRFERAGFAAKDDSATVQSYFQLEKPVYELVPYIARLEYDVNEEIGVPSMKVVVLSMHQSDSSNRTDVVFGFLPDPINSTMNPVALSLLKSSLIDLFLQQYNLTLTFSIFGEPSSFEILKFPGGVTIIPERSVLISQPLLNFTLNSSIFDIKKNLPDLKEQLRLGLQLLPNEVVYIQVTNKHGSTKDPPVIVEASVASDRTILPERLRQLAQIITVSPTKNLGLNHSVFGKVKEISLSSFLNRSLHSPTPSPSPSPSPSPEGIHDTGPSIAPSNHPVSEPSAASLPSAPIPQNIPYYSSSPTPDSLAPSISQGNPPCSSSDPPISSPPLHSEQISPNFSPRAPKGSPPAVLSPQVSPGRPNGYHSSNEVLTAGSWRIQWFYLNGLLTFFVIFWIS